MPSIKREKDRLSSFSSVSSNSSPGKSEKKNLAILEISVRNRSATLGRNLFEAKGKDKEKR